MYEAKMRLSRLEKAIYMSGLHVNEDKFRGLS